MNALLLAYPSRMRRRHGAELLHALMEVDGPPSLTTRLRFVLDGLGQRFRLPAGRPIGVVVAVLALMVGGALGAAGGAFTASFGYAELPAPRAAGGACSDARQHADQPERGRPLPERC